MTTGRIVSVLRGMNMGESEREAQRARAAVRGEDMAESVVWRIGTPSSWLLGQYSPGRGRERKRDTERGRAAVR